jgi:hypothetical protein
MNHESHEPVLYADEVFAIQDASDGFKKTSVATLLDDRLTVS